MLRSFVSAVVGWIAAVLFFGSHFLITLGRSSVTGVFAFWRLAGVVIFAVWLVLLLPLYLLVPRRSLLWHPAACILGGGIAGALILAGVYCWFGRVSHTPVTRSFAEAFQLPFFYAGPLVGAITCATGCILKRREPPKT